MVRSPLMSFIVARYIDTTLIYKCMEPTDDRISSLMCSITSVMFSALSGRVLAAVGCVKFDFC